MNAGFRRTVLRVDGAFLLVVGAAAMAADAAGHFFGIGPLAGMRGSPHSIGGFEAHGLAVVIGVLLWRSARAPAPSSHTLGLVVHLLLGGANLLFWSSFIQLDMVAMGVVTTVCHGLFVVAQSACLWAGRSPQRS